MWIKPDDDEAHLEPAGAELPAGRPMPVRVKAPAELASPEYED
jgi:hypothetical protein